MEKQHEGQKQSVVAQSASHSLDYDESAWLEFSSTVEFEHEYDDLCSL